MPKRNSPKRNSNRQRTNLHRQLRIEGLEKRALLAGDCFHNVVLPEDTDGSGNVSPLDALVVINQINQANGQTGGPTAQSTTPAPIAKMVDVNADGTLSPLDALGVINQLNAMTSSPSSRRPSLVEVERRIERIEKVLEEDRLPPSMAREQVMAALETLRAGGRPELGDRIVNGVLKWHDDDHPSDDDLNESDPNSGGNSDDDSLVRIEAKMLERMKQFTESLAERLATFGVNATVIQTISSELLAAHQAGTPMDFQQLRTRLVELGVNADAILPRPIHPETPERPENPERPETPERPENPIMPAIMVTEPIAQGLRTRWQLAGVSPAVIETLWTEITTAIAAGTPMDLQAVRRRLEELGVRWDLEPSRPRPVGIEALRQVLPALGRLGINAQVIRTLYTEIQASIANGTPMSLDAIMTRLRELGVNLNSASLSTL